MRGMETNPIHASFMSLKHLDTLNFNADEGREILTLSEFFLENSVIPNPNRGVKGGTDNEIFLWMELGTHHIMTMPGNNIDTRPTLIVPNPHSLIITRGQNPRQLVVEVGCTNVVDMAFEGEEATLLFIVPDLDETVVPAGDE